MDLCIHGTGGKPMLVFSCQGGKAVEFADFGMVDVVRPYLEQEQLRVFTVDSVDNQSWANWNAPPRDRALRHEQYDRFILSEVVPFIRRYYNGAEVQCLTFGCSMGAYHAANFLFRHPDVFDSAISLSGVFDLRLFIGDYMDENVYFNSPLHYLRNLTDPWYLEAYRRNKIIICCGQGAWEDHMLADIRQLDEILKEKHIPAWIDVWGYDVNHDWPWWRIQLPYFLGHLLPE